MTDRPVEPSQSFTLSGPVVRELTIADGRLSTSALRLANGTRLELVTRELEVVLATDVWRHEIATWRWHEVDDPADLAPAEPQFDDAHWRIVPHLHPVFDTRTDRTSWFRTTITIPRELAASDLELVIGGLDDEDWSSYAVWLDGVAVSEWMGAGSIREPRHMAIAPGTDLHDRLRFGEPLVLAVRATGLDRTHLVGIRHEREHFFFQGWLVDQYIAVVGATLTLADFGVSKANQSVGGEIEVVLENQRAPELAATLRYAADEWGIRKVIELHNRGSDAMTVLDVVGEDWQGDLEATGGGRGQPVWLGGSAYAGIEHPAGVNQCDRGRLRLTQMPGVSIAPGQHWTSRPFVVGGDPGRPAEASFRDYVRSLRPRSPVRRTVYSALGWYDFTNPADPLPELTADLVTENLRQLDELREQGATFDIYMLDDWWEPTDLSRFRRSAFPNGGDSIGRQIRQAEMEPGLWWATTRALWSSGEAPGIEAAYANDPTFGSSAALAGGAWKWLEEFGNLFIGERRLCLAAEPYRSMFQQALPAHVSGLGIALLKLDCVVLHCTSAEHDHRPGRHSMEAMVDALEVMLDRCRDVRPDLQVVWYWGFRSPWFLGLGDVVFDKGLLMEAATPSSAPLPTPRQAMSLNVDQSIEHAAALPLELQDSLGIWVGDVAWCNRMGSEEWREACVLDVARGSDLVQFWGDLTLLDATDREFLARIHRWVGRLGRPGDSTVRIGGSAWNAEPYGYARPADGGVVMTVVNPGWHAATMPFDRLLAHAPPSPRGLLELYPHPGVVEPTEMIELAPFEVRVLAVVPAGRIPLGTASQQRVAVRPTRTIEVGTFGALSSVSEGTWQTVSGELRMPDVELGDILYVTHRLIRDGEWTYHPEPQAHVRFDAGLDGLAVHQETMPRQRDRNGPGSSWIIRRIRVGPKWSGRDLRIVISTDLPLGTEVKTEARVVDAWWRREERSFRDLLGDGGPRGSETHAPTLNAPL